MRLFQEFMQTFKRLGLEYYQRYYSIYPAIVLDNNDPDKRGRIKVSMPNVLGKINGGVHPKWVVPHHANIAGKNTGEFFPPYKNEIVDVMFENGDVNYPIYKGGSWAAGELPQDFKTGYPNVRGWVFKSGQKIIIDETDGKLKIKLANPSGSQVVIDDEQKSVLVSDNVGDLVEFKDGQITIQDKSGDVMIFKNGTIAMSDKDGDRIEMSAGQLVSQIKTIVSFLTKKVVLGEDVMSGALGEPLQSWNDSHQHISGLPGTPTSPAIVPGSSFAGTPLDYKALFIKMRGNS